MAKSQPVKYSGGVETTIKAVIFDMDGVIIDSEPIQSLAFKEVLAEYGIGPIPEAVVQTPGIRGRENWEILKKRYHLQEDTDVLVEKRMAVYLRLLRDHLKPRSGFMALLRALKERGYQVALGSSSTTSVQVVVEGLGLESVFDAVVTGLEAVNAKPHPEIFLRTAEKLGLKPEECLVVEDSEPGVEAAKRAGMWCIAAPNDTTRDHDHSPADLIVHSLEEITMDAIERLAGRSSE